MAVGGHSADGAEPKKPRPSERTLRTRFALSLIGVGALLAGLITAGWALHDWPRNCSGKPLVVNVAAAPDIAPAMLEVAGRFNVQPRDINGQCVVVQVAERESAQVARSLGGQSLGGEKVAADGWVPESSMWLTVARGSARGAKALSPEAPSVASSPMVLGTTRTVAEEFRKQQVKPSWRMLFPGVVKAFGGPTSDVETSAQILDPANSAAGIATMVAARQVIGNEPKAPEVLTAFVRTVQRNVSADSSVLFTHLAAPPGAPRPLVVTSEQSVVSYNDKHRDAPVTALVPDEGTILMDYPFVVTTQDSVRKEAVEAFRWALRSKLGIDAIQRAGFRTPEGVLDGQIARQYELNGLTPKLMTSPKPGQVDEALQAWNRLGLGSRILLLMDVSGSMEDTVPGRDTTRMQVAVQAAQTALGLFPDDTDFGLWKFSTLLDGKRDYKELVSLGPVPESLGARTRRQEIAHAFGSIKAKQDGDTGLYDSILAAYQTVKQGWKPDKFNAVLVFTDGNNDDADGISLKSLLDTLAKETDPQRPIQVITVAFGPDVDAEPLKKVAQATNGAVYVTRDPREVPNVFMQSVARRLCTPNCPQSS